MSFAVSSVIDVLDRQVPSNKPKLFKTGMSHVSSQVQIHELLYKVDRLDLRHSNFNLTPNMSNIVEYIEHILNKYLY